jgi:hypothetical protein
MSSVLTAMCADAGFVPRVRHEVDETSTLVTLVAAGLGVAIVPDPTAALDIAGVCYRELTPATLGVDLVVAHRVGKISAVIEQALTVLRSVGRTDSANDLSQRIFDDYIIWASTLAPTRCRGPRPEPPTPARASHRPISGLHASTS